MKGPYDDMIYLPRHVSPKHPPMPLADRAAQFSPFAALSGYEDAIRETARLTGERAVLEEEQQAALDRRLRFALEHIAERRELSVTYFQPDTKKSGGAYVTAAGVLKKIDRNRGEVVLEDGRRIPIADIYRVEGELFDALFTGDCPE